jgi:charged multivesicular body protein 2A
MGIFDFFRSKTNAEQLKENKRIIDRAVREIEREKMRLENQEKVSIIEIKKMAKLGQTEACKTLAKDVVRTRNYISKFYQMKAQLSSISMQLQVYLL